MIGLISYVPAYEKDTLRRISEFFGFHRSLVYGAARLGGCNDLCSPESRKTLTEWLTHPSALFVIADGGVSVGLIRVGYRGPNVAWIEDIFVDAGHRGRVSPRPRSGRLRRPSKRLRAIPPLERFPESCVISFSRFLKKTGRMNYRRRKNQTNMMER